MGVLSGFEQPKSAVTETVQGVYRAENLPCGWKRAGLLPFNPLLVLAGDDFKKVEHAGEAATLFETNPDPAAWVQQARQLPTRQPEGISSSNQLYCCDLASEEVQFLLHAQQQAREASQRAKSRRENDLQRAALGELDEVLPRV